MVKSKNSLITRQEGVNDDGNYVIYGMIETKSGLLVQIAFSCVEEDITDYAFVKVLADLGVDNGSE